MSVARHTVYNIAGAAVPVLVSLVTVPAYLSVVGFARYGILAICWLMLGYFNLFDLGLGRAVSQKLASLEAATPEERSRVFWTAIFLSAALIAIAVLLFFPVSWIVLNRMHFDAQSLRSEVLLALPWLTATVPFGIANGVVAGSLEGRRRFLEINLIGSFSTVAGAVLPLGVAIVFGPALWHLVAAALFGRGISMTLLALACRRAVPVLAPTRPHRADAVGLLRFGGWATLTNTVGPVLYLWDRFAIGAVIGSAAVGLYVVPFNLIAQLTVLPTSLASALFPRIAAASEEDGRRITGESVGLLAFVLTPITLGVFMVVGPFLDLWLGSATGEPAAPIAFILATGGWANSLARVAFAELQARGRPDLPARTHLAELLPYLVLLYLGLKTLGIAGAAGVWSLRCIADALILFYFSRVGLRSLLPLLADFALVAAGMAVSLTLATWSPLRFALIGGLLLVWISVAWRRRPERLDALWNHWRGRLRLGGAAG
jgi:O-antigen/teichoic acid export membrane protein